MKVKVKRTEMVFDGSQGNAFLRNACDKAAPSNALPAGRCINFVPNSDTSDELEKAENKHKQYMAELLTISKGVIDNSKLFSGIARTAIIKILR